MWSRIDDRLQSILIFLFYCYLVIIIVYEVSQRFLFGISSTWGAESAIYAYIWMTYLACARGVKLRTHLRVEIFPEKVGRTGNLLIYLLSDVCFLIVAVFIVVTSIQMVTGNFKYHHTFIGADVPLWIATIAIPIGWTLIGVRIIERAIRTLRAYFSGLPLAPINQYQG